MNVLSLVQRSDQTFLCPSMILMQLQLEKRNVAGCVSTVVGALGLAVQAPPVVLNTRIADKSGISSVEEEHD